jgi:hypothetical protein
MSEPILNVAAGTQPIPAAGAVRCGRVSIVSVNGRRSDAQVRDPDAARIIRNR